MSQRMVRCSKFGREMPGLSKPPFPGEIGKLIYENVSEEAWNIWNNEVKIKVLNEYRLNMADPNDYAMLKEQMLVFLNLKEGDNLEVENEERGKGG
ncbi:MAG: oxidative damage protection protein [Candidatus Dadabacteria bacterium]|nr:MAG: oxidative damage protection protein [Candidatus Dadabacteria bacterium]